MGLSRVWGVVSVLVVVIGFAGTAGADLAPPVLLGQVGGLCNTMTVEGDYLYAGEGMSLAIYALDSDTGCPTRVSSICLSGWVNRIAVRDQKVYAAANDGGFCVVDVSAPSAPQIISRLPLSGDATHLALGNGVAYVSWVNESGIGGVSIVDISQPASATIAGAYVPDAPVTALYFCDATLYVAWGHSPGGCDVLDVTTPTAPVWERDATGFGGITDMCVVNGIGYMAFYDLDLVTVDMTEPDLPNVLGVLEGGISKMVVSGSTVYTISQYISSESYYCTHLVIVDVTDPVEMTLVGVHDIPDGVSCLAKKDEKIYVGGLGSYVETVDVSTPASPSSSCTLGFTGSFVEMANEGEHAYLASTSFDVYPSGDTTLPLSPGGFRVVDITDPALPVYRGEYRSLLAGTCMSLGMSTYRIATSMDLVCAAWSTYVDLVPTGRLELVDVSNPDSPSCVGTWAPSDGWPVDVECAAGFAYVAVWGEDCGSCVYVLDLSLPSSPVVKSMCTLRDSDYFSGMMGMGDGYLYVAWTDVEPGFKHFDVVDVRDATAPQFVGTFTLLYGATAWGFEDLFVYGSTAYALLSGTGPWLSILDASLPTSPYSPRTLEFSHTYRWVSGVFCEFDRLYLATSSGLVRMGTTEPANPVTLDTTAEMAYGSKIVAEDGLLYVADDECGLRILDDGRRPLTIVVEGHGTTDPAPGKSPYDTGTEVTIAATPEAGYKLDHWTGDVESGTTANPLVVTVDAKKSVTAVFAEITYTLTTSKQGFGYTDPAPGAHVFVHDTPVTVTATPEEGWRFDHWEGDFGDNATANPIVVAMTGDRSVTAVFVAITHTLSLSVEGQGTISPEAGDHTYTYGTQVTLTATPADGWRFDRWESTISKANTDNPVTVTVDHDQVITAVFVEDTAGCSGGTGSASDTALISLVALGLWLGSVLQRISRAAPPTS